VLTMTNATMFWAGPTFTTATGSADRSLLRRP
jgi:hypothetical protein